MRMPHAKITQRTTLILGSDDDELEDGQRVGMQGYGFTVTREDNMVHIEGATEGGDEFEIFIMRDLFPKIRSVMTTVDTAFGGAVQEEACAAEVRHGPGHQSRTKCELKGEHEVHRAVYMGTEATWRGEFAYTGAFD